MNARPSQLHSCDRAEPGPGTSSRFDSSRHPGRLREIAVSLLGAGAALLFARASIHFYIHTHRLIGLLFVVQQLWVAAAFFVRRAARTVSGRPLDWVVALGGSFGSFLLRPDGWHPHWGVAIGVVVQTVGLTAWIVSFAFLGRSFGLVAADRGLVTRGPYALVRHPLYGAYMVTQLGYLLQSISIWNGLVLAVTWSCQVVRAVAEERLLETTPAYAEYREIVRWRLVRGVW